MSSPIGASSFSSTPSSSSRSGRASVLGLGADLLEGDPLGQQPQLGSARTVPGGVAALDQVVDAVADGGGVGVAVDPRQRAEEVQLARAPGRGPAARSGTRAATLRSTSESTGSPSRSSSRVPKTSRIAARKSAHRPLAVTMCRPKVRPARGELLDLRLEVVEVRAEGVPAVDDEEHVAVPVVGPAGRAAGPVGLDRVDALGAEVRLAPVHDAGHLGHDPPDDVRLGAGADAGDVRQPGERGEGAAAEVQDEDLRLLGRGGQRHAGDDGAQQRALAAARTADHRDVPAGAGEVDGQGVAALLAGPVDGAERHHQPAQPAPVRGDQAELGVLGEVAHQLVEGVGHVERRQPDLVGRRSLADHVLDGHVEERLLLALVDGPLDHLGLVVDRVDGLHLGDGEGQDALHVAALVAAYPRPAGGRRPGDVRRLEPEHRRRVGLEVAQARHRRQLVGIGHAEHRAGLLGAERAQADPVGQVGLEAAQAALLQPLGGEQQVQTERAAEPPDGHEQVDELRLGRQHLGELVDDEEQRRHRGQRLAGGPGLLVVADRGVVAGLAQQLLATHHLARTGRPACGRPGSAPARGW